MINEKDLTIVLDNQCEMKIEDDVQDVLIAENQEGEAKTEITQVEQEIKKQIIEEEIVECEILNNEKTEINDDKAKNCEDGFCVDKISSQEDLSQENLVQEDMVQENCFNSHENVDETLNNEAVEKIENDNIDCENKTDVEKDADVIVEYSIVN